MKYQNNPQDLSISYKVKTYTELEKLFNLKDDETPMFHFMLSLLGFKHGRRVDIKTTDSSSDKARDFSLRTIYPRNESDMDAYYGLIAILDNTELDYNQVVNQIAFERTAVNNTPFLKMTNVRTFYEYMLGGIEFLEEGILCDGPYPERVAVLLHQYLLEDDSEISDTLAQLIAEEGVL
ncbi:MAG: hypothetical protein RBQ95_01410 [Paracholeplasma sp.]|nr:hypothetical protein [Paracholeplasma sp.]MDY3195490.1 hypothetical protein [Paracholeplasma sp.]